MISVNLNITDLIILIIVWSVVGGFVQGFFRAAGADTREWWERRRRG